MAPSPGAQWRRLACAWESMGPDAAPTCGFPVCPLYQDNGLLRQREWALGKDKAATASISPVGTQCGLVGAHGPAEPLISRPGSKKAGEEETGSPNPDDLKPPPGPTS